MDNKIIIFTLLASILPMSALAENAQQKNTNGIERMAKDLGLSDEQKTRVETIINTEKQTVETIFKEEAEKLKAAQAQTKNDLQQILTPEQMSKLDKKIQERSKKKH
jgi:Spy/CpxP family protein refolding chaperone